MLPRHRKIKRSKASNSKSFESVDQGEIKWILGMQVSSNMKNQTIHLSQQAYADNMLEKFDLLNCTSTKTPMETSFNSNSHDSSTSKTLP